MHSGGQQPTQRDSCPVCTLGCATAVVRTRVAQSVSERCHTGRAILGRLWQVRGFDGPPRAWSHGCCRLGPPSRPVVLPWRFFWAEEASYPCYIHKRWHCCVLHRGRSTMAQLYGRFIPLLLPHQPPLLPPLDVLYYIPLDVQGRA